MINLKNDSEVMYDMANHASLQDYQAHFDDYLKSHSMEELCSFFAYYEKFLQKKNMLRVYMITFTIDRSKCKKSVEECKTFLIATLTRAEINPVRLVVVEEFCKTGESHFHCLVKVRDKTLVKHHFSGWVKNYGNIDMGRNRYKGRTIESQEEAIIAYMSKDKKPVTII